MKKPILFLVIALVAASTVVAQDWAKARLEKSPRHLEWVKVKHGDREVNCSIAYPEVKDKATAVIVIHEIFGLTDWVRGVTDQLAEAGYIAIAPDLFSGSAPGGGAPAPSENRPATTVSFGSSSPRYVMTYSRDKSPRPFKSSISSRFTPRPVTRARSTGISLGCVSGRRADSSSCSAGA